MPAGAPTLTREQDEGDLRRRRRCSAARCRSPRPARRSRSAPRSLTRAGTKQIELGRRGRLELEPATFTFTTVPTAQTDVHRQLAGDPGHRGSLSSAVTVKVAPRIGIASSGRSVATSPSPPRRPRRSPTRASRSYVQRRNAFGQWVSLKRVVLKSSTVATRTTVRLPKGPLQHPHPDAAGPGRHRLRHRRQPGGPDPSLGARNQTIELGRRRRAPSISPATCPPASKRRATSAQLTTFHQAAR